MVVADLDPDRATSMLVRVALACTIACEPLLSQVEDPEDFSACLNKGW